MLKSIKFLMVKFIKYSCKFYFPYLLLHIRQSFKINKNVNDLENKSKEFIDKISKIKEYNVDNKKIYIILEGAAGDTAYYFLPLKYLLSYLFTKTNKVFIIGNEKYIDIYNLFLCFFPRLKILGIKNFLGHDILSADVKSILGIDDSDIIIDYREQSSLQWMFKLYGSYFQYCSYLKNVFINIFDLNGIKIRPVKNYSYYNINCEKIDKLLLHYNNPNGLIICNFENRSYKLAKRDAISFNDYKKCVIEISKGKNLNFVINSVYDGEKGFEDDNVLVTRLNFQEIIRLAEHEKIKLFISERNGLNDVFRVFFPGINQIIYYPDYYFPCVDKKVYQKLFGKKLKGVDVRDCWHLPGDNIIEDIRGNFCNTLEKNIKNMFKD